MSLEMAFSYELLVTTLIAADERSLSSLIICILRSFPYMSSDMCLEVSCLSELLEAFEKRTCQSPMVSFRPSRSFDTLTLERHCLQ